MKVDLVVVSWKSPMDLRGFLNAYFDAHISVSHKLWVVVNESDDEDIEVLSQYPSVSVTLNHENEGYARAVNQAVKLGRSEVVAIFNADTRILSGVVEACYEQLTTHKDWAVVGPRQVDDEGKLTYAGVAGTQSAPQLRFWMQRDRGQADGILEDCPTVLGAAYFIKRSVWNELAQCPDYLKAAPDAEGAFLPTPHYYEETYCVPKGEWIWTSGGPVRIEDIESGQKIWSFQESTGKVVTANVSCASMTGVKECLRIVSSKGRSISVSLDHEIPIVEAGNRNLETGSLVWKKARDVKIGDYLLKIVGGPEEAVGVPPGVTLEVMQFFGCFLGDGCLDKRAIHMSLPTDDRCRGFYEDLSRIVFRRKSRWTRKGHLSVDEEYTEISIQSILRAFRFNTVEGVQWMKDLGFKGRAWEKRIPVWVFSTPIEYRLNLLAGLVDSDGHVDKTGSLSFGLTSEGLIQDIAQLAVSCGLPVGRTITTEGKTVTFPQGHVSQGRPVWTVSIADPSAIPFHDSLYRQRVRTVLRRPGGTLARAVGLHPSIHTARVTSIEELGPLSVYDLTVPATSTFVVSGVPVHNCSYHARQHGYKCVYYGPVHMIHRWHKASPVGGFADKLFNVSREQFRKACDVHGPNGIEHD